MTWLPQLCQLQTVLQQFELGYLIFHLSGIDGVASKWVGWRIVVDDIKLVKVQLIVPLAPTPSCFVAAVTIIISVPSPMRAVAAVCAAR